MICKALQKDATRTMSYYAELPYKRKKEKSYVKKLPRKTTS